ncbi:MAG TPA: folate-binding protein, partial [Rubrivivax sp.]|nr:folate-binding protein [Rubrivivax sp.]
MNAVPFEGPPPQGAVRLTDWGVIRATGADARSFLHGQLTQDTLHLEPGRARLSGYCSPKGRLLASFVMWTEAASGDVLLACSADVLPATLKRLSMFVLRAKCKLVDASAALPLYGWAGAAVPGALPWTVTEGAAGTAVRLPDAAGQRRGLWIGAEPPVPELLAPQDWQWLEVMSAVPRIVAATAEQFVPQMINLEAVGGVNFQKGCYPGQEVVARSQYRGTLKRRAFLVRSEAALQPGQEVFDAADPGQPAGMVVLAAAPAGLPAVAL